MKFLIALFAFSIAYIHTVAQNNTKAVPQKATNANSGYLVNATITPYKNCWMYLGSYYGKNKILVDSAWFNDKSEAIFKGNKKLPGGHLLFCIPFPHLIVRNFNG